MATTQTDARMGAAPRKPAHAPRNSRGNEIVAVALLAAGALLALCLFSYSPFDPSWNASGQDETRNLAGRVGANVSAVLFQGFGLASVLVPVLLFAAALRRFRPRRIHAPLTRVLGLLFMVIAAAALLNIYLPRASFGGTFESGGVLGVLVADGLQGILNTVGATVLLAALAATGLLLATNFSFARAYERVAAAANNPSGSIHKVLEKFNAWRAARTARAEERKRLRSEARAEREREELERAALEASATAAAADAAAQPTIAAALARPKRRASTPSAAEAIQRSATGTDEAAAREDEIRAQLAHAEAGLRSIIAQPSTPPILSRNQPTTNTAAKQQQRVIAPPMRFNSAAPAPADPLAPKPSVDPAELEEMLREAEVVRTELEEEEDVIAPAAKRRAVGAEAPPSPVKRSLAALDYKIPEHEFLNAPPPRHEQADEELLEIASRVAEKCREFNVTGQIKHICPGPVVTTYEFKPDPGVKYSRVTGLVDDLCIALEAESVRIDRLPGKPHVGIEVPNPKRETILLREVLESRQFRESESKLTLALGKTIDGMNYVADLARMPHLLIAGATGTGKSVCLNSLVVSILYKARPDEVKFIMIDPKRLELGLYADIPHLATPIITEPKKAANALKWAVSQMEQRYKDLARWGVRNIDGYNAEVERRNNVLDFDDEGHPWKTLPYVVIIIDELADLMMTCGSDVEESITRLAQMARAVGIHLVLATQRPSVDVITGVIKANFPSRIAFRVSSKVDSRTIIDANGAEQLLGRGDMLFLPPGSSRLVRVHGAYLDEQEVGRVVTHIKSQSEPVYDETITQSEEEAAGPNGAGGERDELFEQALRICVEMKRASTSVLQRRMRIGYGRAAAILDALERDGFIGQADGARPRPVLGRAFETVSHWDDLQNDSAEDY